jgi:hypothetical protein
MAFIIFGIKIMKNMGQFFHIDSFWITPGYCFPNDFAIPGVYSTFLSLLSLLKN